MKQNDFTQGPILAPLLKFMIPVMITLFLQTLYGAVDLWVVGRFSTPEEVAAVAAGSQMLQLVTEIIANLSLGTTVLLGSLLGRRRTRLAGKAISTTILFFAAVALCLTVLLFLGAPLFSHALEIPEAALPSTLSYVRICGAGLLFIVGYNVLGAMAFRVPLSWLLSRIEPVSIFRIGLANPLASIAQIIMCAAYFLHEKKQGFRDII